MLLDIRDDHLKIVQDILQKFVPDREVWAFGSRAKWLAKEYSDLDLCIVGETPLSFRTLGLLEEAFEDSDLPYKVDVVDWATTSESFRKIIERDRVVVQRAAWPLMTIDDCMEAIIDYRGKTPVKINSGIPLITAKIVKGGRIEEPEEFIAESDFAAWMTRGLPRAGDVVLTTEAPLGEVAQLDDRKVALAQRIITLRGKANLLDNKFLKFILQSEGVQAKLAGRASGSTVSGIKQSELRKIELPIPPLRTQRKIAKTLGDIDDKIALNRRINQTLEAMAQAIFKSWFVDFDPVKAKIAARQALTPALSQEERQEIVLRAAMSAISGKPDAELDALPPEQYAPLAATAALFPEEMEESELGEIPRGWKAAVLADLTIKIGSGSTPRGGKEVYLDDGVALIRSQNVYDSEFVWDGLARISDDAAQQLKNVEVKPADVLLNITGASILRTCVAIPDVLPARVNQHVVIIRAKENIPPRFIHHHLLQQKTKDFLLGLNTGGSREAVTKAHIESTPIIRPADAVLMAFQNRVNAVYLENESLARQGRNLANLRDTLLPKLLSGELSVENISPESEAMA